MFQDILLFLKVTIVLQSENNLKENIKNYLSTYNVQILLAKSLCAFYTLEVVGDANEIVVGRR